MAIDRNPFEKADAPVRKVDEETQDLVSKAMKEADGDFAVAVGALAGDDYFGDKASAEQRLAAVSELVRLQTPTGPINAMAVVKRLTETMSTTEKRELIAQLPPELKNAYIRIVMGRAANEAHKNNRTYRQQLRVLGARSVRRKQRRRDDGRR